MYEKEIKNCAWKVSSDLKIVKIDIFAIPENESECHLNIMKIGEDNENSEILIDCSYIKYMTKLRKSEYFTLKEILISTKRIDEKLGGFILEIKGSMLIKGIIFKKKQKIYTEKEKMELQKRFVKTS